MVHLIAQAISIGELVTALLNLLFVPHGLLYSTTSVGLCRLPADLLRNSCACRKLSNTIFTIHVCNPVWWIVGIKSNLFPEKLPTVPFLTLFHHRKHLTSTFSEKYKAACEEEI